MIPVGAHTLHECSRCGGLWVERADFEAICLRQEEQEAVLGMQSRAEPSPSKPKPQPGRAYVPCPQCGKLMNRDNFAGCSGIVLDLCREHGIWFDRAELQQLAVFIRDGGLRKARHCEQNRLQAERERLRAQEFRLAALAGHCGVSLSEALSLKAEEDSLLQHLSKLMFR